MVKWLEFEFEFENNTPHGLADHFFAGEPMKKFYATNFSSSTL